MACRLGWLQVLLRSVWGADRPHACRTARRSGALTRRSGALTAPFTRLLKQDAGIPSSQQAASITPASSVSRSLLAMAMRLFGLRGHCRADDACCYGRP
jgi:hypothetical protein